MGMRTKTKGMKTMKTMMRETRKVLRMVRKTKIDAFSLKIGQLV